MFSHVMLGVSDFDQAMAFYKPIMQALGLEIRFVDTARPWAGWQLKPDTRPLFLIGRPYNQQPHDAGNGQMVAFSATTRELVQQVYQLAITLGGRCAGQPRLRPEYHPHYYGAYFYDRDGNKICIVCHEATAD